MIENSYKSKLIEYIKKNLKKGYPVDTLKIALVNQGYMRPMIEESVQEAIKQMALEAPTIKEKPQIEHELIIEEPVVEKKSFLKKIWAWFKK
jgi:hypothetical protein